MTDDGGLRPAYRRPERESGHSGQSAPEPEPAVDDADLERGRTLAVISAIGRLQMSIDVLARQQKTHAEEVEARLARIERALAERG